MRRFFPVAFLVMALLIPNLCFDVQAHSGDEIVAVDGTTPTLDGTISLGEWDDASTVIFSVTDGTCTVYVKQDGTSLYVAFNISDTTYHDSGDFCNVYLDVDHDGASAPQTDDVVLQVCRAASWIQREARGTGSEWEYVPPVGWTAFRSSTAEGFQIEYSIPYSKIDVTDGVDKTLGVGFCTRDNVLGGISVYCWPPGLYRPDTWADLIFGIGGCDFEVQLSAGWNMVSFPCIPEEPSFSNIFSEVGYYQVATWDGTRYIEPTVAESGWGYWVFVLEDTTVTVTNGIRVESYELDLPPGWSMIGSIITCTVDADLVFPSFYQLLTWDDVSYVDAKTMGIEPGKGYWALVLESAHIAVDVSCCTSSQTYAEVSRSHVKNSGASEEWAVHLSATLEEYSDLSVFGVKTDATEGFDLAYDQVDPPQPPVGVVSYFWYPYNPTSPVDLRRLSTSEIPSRLPMNWTYRVMPTGIDGIMVIEWTAEEIDSMPSEYSVHLLNSKEEVVANMRGTNEYSFQSESGTTYEFTIHVIPEFPSIIIIMFFMTATLLTVTICKRKHLQ